MNNFPLFKGSRSVLVVAGIILVWCSVVSGQSICPLETVKVEKIQGRVMIPAEHGSRPLPHTKVEVEKFGNPDRFISAVETDENGMFQIDGIERGEYRLSVRYIVNAIEIVPKFDIILDVERSDVSKSNKFLSVLLTYDCAENQVKVIKMNDAGKPTSLQD
ncbi:MAG: carboxypeptidase-like regulatory domain-containing protein [Acidobacteria bacterium]|nr:carboxypeptidase-like regulatory domain-containing protein [Acidobacteriota bacterium]